LELGFATKKLRQICQQEASARKMLGDEAAAGLRRRLADLEAVDAITELPWLPITYGYDGEASIEFHSGYSLNVVAIRGAPRMVENLETDWTTVDRIKLVDIVKP
jgi:methionine aminopeptidase